MRADKVKGLVPEKKDWSDFVKHDAGGMEDAKMHDDLISTIGSKELVLDTLELAKAIKENDGDFYDILRTNFTPEMIRDIYWSLATAIASRIEDMLKVERE